MFFLHGIFGMGTNFRSVAKALSARLPEWGFVLVDLRGHGASQGFAPPHTLAAAADDVEALAASLGLRIDGIAGHSFGGKVSLQLLSARTEPVDAALILDSMPGTRSPTEELGDPMRVLATLESISFPLPSREAFRERLLADHYSVALTDWLTMNVRLDGGAYGLRLDLPAIRALLADYLATDLWRVVELPSAAREIRVVVGGRSEVFHEQARARLLAARGTNPQLYVSLLENAGHWVHVDDPKGLLDAMSETMQHAGSGSRS
jgi:esterase